MKFKPSPCHPGQQAPKHFHPCPVVGYVASGSVLFQIEGEESTIIPQGGAFYKPKVKDNIMTIYITQLIYIKEGKEDIFDQFERVAIPAIARYNGQMLLRVRPEQKDFIENQIEQPYEIHLASFPTEEDFQQFMQDEERKQFLHLKEQSIRSSILIKGNKL